MWFYNLMGFHECDSKQVHESIEVIGTRLRSKVNGQSYVFGSLSTPSLSELRKLSPSPDDFDAKLKLSEVVGDVQVLHCDEASNGAFFQAASQFNLLEMVGPDVSPERGVDIYEHDLTQGPACAIACGAGTIFRNYFADVNGQKGQTSENQIDCLKTIGEDLENSKLGLWHMSNGYALATSQGLRHICKVLDGISENEYERLKGLLKIGVQADTQVTLRNSPNFVSQAYCAALPIAYTNIGFSLWEPFARLILEATYEATLYAALINYTKTKNNSVYLTLVGGGVFGNKIDWILDAIQKACLLFSMTPLDVRIVSYGNSNPDVKNFVDTFNQTL